MYDSIAIQCIISRTIYILHLIGTVAIVSRLSTLECLFRYKPLANWLSYLHEPSTFGKRLKLAYLIYSKCFVLTIAESKRYIATLSFRRPAPLKRLQIACNRFACTPFFHRTRKFAGKTETTKYLRTICEIPKMIRQHLDWTIKQLTSISSVRVHCTQYFSNVIVIINLQCLTRLFCLASITNRNCTAFN